MSCCSRGLLTTAVGLAAVTSIVSGASAEDQEWTLERARDTWRPMVHPVEHVGVPGYQFQAGVMWDGSLVFGPLGFRYLGVMQREVAPLGSNLLHVSVGFGDPMRFVDRKGTNRPGLRRWLEDGRVPIPHVETRDGWLVWDQCVFAHLLGRDFAEGMSPRNDDTLVAHSTFTVRNTGSEPAVGHLWLHFGDTSQVWLGYKCGMGAELAPPIDDAFVAPLGVVGDEVRYALPTPREGTLVWHDEVPPPDGMAQPGRKLIEWRVPLEPGETAELRLLIPYGLVDRATGKRIAHLDTRRLHEEVRDAWRKLIFGPGQIITPDPWLNDYLAAVPAHMAEQTGYREQTKVWMYKTSPNHYEGYWPCNAAKALPALDFRGLRRISEPVLGSFVDAETDDYGKLTAELRGQGGVVRGEGFERRPGFLGNFGEWTANTLLISHGLELWALASHCRITRDREWLGDGPGSPLQAMVDGCDWIAAQRRRTMREENGVRVPHWGLLPAAAAHDWLSGNTIFNDAYCIYGMTECVRVLREIGDPRAEDLAAELADYRQCLHDRYVDATAAARPVPMPDGSLLPYVPRDIYEPDWRGLDWTYTGYGPTRAGAWGALDPFDELVNQSELFLEVGMPQGEGRYMKAHIVNPDIADANFADIGDPETPRHWLWRHYVEYETMWPIGGPLFLARDDLPRFFEWLFNNLAAVLHHDWRVGVESLDGVPSCAPGDGERWQVIRAMFVSERGGYDGSQQSLWLLQAIPRSWLKPGDHLAVKDMGTRFGGIVNLSVDVAKEGDSVKVTANLDLVEMPTEVRMRLRSGDSRPLKSATINGIGTEVLEGDTITLPRELKGMYDVVGRF